MGKLKRTTLLFTLIAYPIILLAQLPVVTLTGNFNDDYSQGSMSVTDGNGTVTYNIKSKWRGSSSKQYDKKSFAVKLLDENNKSLDAPILGMREDNNWILDAMAIDKARMRNRVSFDLWNDMAMPSFIKSNYEEEAFNGTHGQFVELYLNGNYHGIYCLTEKIDRKQLKLKKYKNGVHGILYKADTWEGTAFWDSPSDFDNSLPTWMGWESQYPDVEDDGETDYKPLYDAIKFVVESSKDTFDAEVGKRFDLPVWNDYFLFIKVILATDNNGKNTFTYIYDKDKDTRLGMAPWDLDATWGRSYDGTTTEHSAINGGNNLSNRLEQNKEYNEAISERYFSLRKDILSADSLKNRFRHYFNLFRNSGAAQRETERWNKTNGIELDFDSEQAYIEQWIDKRLEALDRHFGQDFSGISPLKHKDNAGKYIYNTNGQKMSGNRILSNGIYIINGKKIVK